MNSSENPPSFWQTVRILLRTSRKRATGRQRRQQELMNNRARKSTFDWSILGVVLSILFFALVNGTAAFVVRSAVVAGERTEATLQGKIVVSQEFLDAANRLYHGPNGRPASPDPVYPNYSHEAADIARHYGGNKAEIQKRLISDLQRHGLQNFVSEDQAAKGLSTLPQSGRIAGLCGSALLFCWIAMLVCQGEGLELDIQRRRYPMWEWLYSHPIPAGAIFLAEMLSPIAANPIYWTAPLFLGILYGLIYGPLLGLAAALLIGIPVTVAAACLGKALEIAILLRFPPRSRGGLVGLMSWAGYATMMLFFVGIYVLSPAISALSHILQWLTILPWPWLGLFLGAKPGGGFLFPLGLAACWLGSGLTLAASIRFSVWGTQRGLAGQFTQSDPGPSANRKGTPRFGREPLYRKEFLWFIRDRSAIVQTILIPLTVAGYQAFNLRFLTEHASEAWNYLCGAAILFGTYFLWVLGPKSLASEGSALWIALTWPRGLENLLKAKAWLWTLISSVLVAIVLVFACFLFPHEIWKIALVAIAWYFFGRSMAEKSVTLVTVTSESGEVQRLPAGRRFASQLGMLTFAIGICTQQWHVAVMGIVYSWITAAAMWQNFRARLPFLYDPWGETLPKPPTLMHAMIAISILIEVGAVVSGIALAIVGRPNLAIAQAFSYGLCAVAVMIGVTNFLGSREVLADQVWLWKPDPPAGPAPGKYDWLYAPPAEPFLKRYGLLDLQLIPALLMGAAGGLALGMLGRAYQSLLAHLPATQELMHKATQQMADNSDLRASYFVMAVIFAPIAEEFLFRGLLYRALDREWGGWRAILGSAAFFAIYHPPLAWVPVGLLGATNCLLFKRTGKLLPCVLLHMVYNAVVLT